MHYTSSQGMSFILSHQNTDGDSQETDYMVLLSGEVELGLSDGTWKTFRQGELIVNAGALHAWRNNTDQWVRESILWLV
jgi:quercetin dioxygenase-like cupin family protein